MAFAFIAVTKVQSSSGASCSGSVSTTAGNMMVCGAASYENGTGTGPLVASGGGTWTSDVTVHDTSSGVNKFDGLLASCPSATGGSQTITVSGGLTNGVTSFIYEFSGNPTSSPLDSSPPAAASGSGTTATTNSEANAQADALFFAVMCNADGANPATVTGTSSGWTYPAGGKETNGATFQVTGTGYKIVSGIGSETSAWTIGSVQWDALIACYKAGGVATTGFAQTLLSDYGQDPRMLLLHMEEMI
jgi:hypothetical protein